MSQWNTNIHEAPRGHTAERVIHVPGKTDRVVKDFHPDVLILAVTNADGSKQVIKSQWVLPTKDHPEGRWLYCTAGQQIDAWAEWPTHPEQSS